MEVLIVLSCVCPPTNPLLWSENKYVSVDAPESKREKSETQRDPTRGFKWCRRRQKSSEIMGNRLCVSSSSIYSYVHQYSSSTSMVKILVRAAFVSGTVTASVHHWLESLHAFTISLTSHLFDIFEDVTIRTRGRTVMGWISRPSNVVERLSPGLCVRDVSSVDVRPHFASGKRMERSRAYVGINSKRRPLFCGGGLYRPAYPYPAHGFLLSFCLFGKAH